MFVTWIDVRFSLAEMRCLSGCLEGLEPDGAVAGFLEKAGYLRRAQVKGGLGYKLTGLGQDMAERCQEALVMRKLPDFGHHMPLEEFAGCVDAGAFIDYDGHGEYATVDQVSGITVRPSTFSLKEVDPMFTHVVWYNK